MRTAIETLETISADERMRELANAREKYRLDQASKLKYAERQGIEKGIKKGMEVGVKQSKIELVRNAINEGVEINLISKLTGLTKAEIEKIREENLN